MRQPSDPRESRGNYWPYIIGGVVVLFLLTLWCDGSTASPPDEPYEPIVRVPDNPKPNQPFIFTNNVPNAGWIVITPDQPDYQAAYDALLESTVLTGPNDDWGDDSIVGRSNTYRVSADSYQILLDVAGKPPFIIPAEEYSTLVSNSLPNVTPAKVLEHALSLAAAYRIELQRRFDHSYIQDVVFSSEGAVFATRLNWVVTPDEVALVCRDLLIGSNTVMQMESLLFDNWTWEQVAIFGAVYGGLREDIHSLEQYCLQAIREAS